MPKDRLEKQANREQIAQGTKSLMERSHINKDTYLNCWCPHCKQGLNEDGKAVFKIVNQQGEEGISRISPYLNVLERESTINVDDDEELADVRCPHCDVSLIQPDYPCIMDGCKMVKMLASISDSEKLLIIFCVKQSCRWYTMSEEDNELLILKDSYEW